MIRHAAHGHRNSFFFITRSQRDLQLFRGQDRIVEEKLVEIAQAKKQECSGMFFFDGGILPHQRSGRLGHLGGLRRIITKRAAVLLRHFAYSRREITAEIAVDCGSLPVFSFLMELRKDPITRSWVITGDDPAETGPRPETACSFCDGSSASPCR